MNGYDTRPLINCTRCGKLQTPLRAVQMAGKWRCVRCMHQRAGSGIFTQKRGA